MLSAVRTCVGSPATAHSRPGVEVSAIAAAWVIVSSPAIAVMTTAEAASALSALRASRFVPTPGEELGYQTVLKRLTSFHGAC
jgi:hypothetical protein